MSIRPGSPAGADDVSGVVVGRKHGVTDFSHSSLQVLMQLPLPGIVIFVHGVNSDGEWFEQGEKGLCDGLNTRLARRDSQLAHHGIEAGQLVAARYIDEIDADGFINPDMNAKTFVQSDDSFSPVIRFRFGYKASAEELQHYGAGIYLNEENYWGGGPFANGCTTLPDLWGQGLSEELFLWIHVQHMNPTDDRPVYSCPPRPYYVLAAYRLAKLIESLRQKQADLPITIVCHSQGNMVGIAAAFLGDKLPEATDGLGHSGRCVADTYVLCNPPYSLVKDNFADSWSQRDMRDPEGRTGRQTVESRTQSLAAFFDIVRQRAPLQQDAARVDQRMGNPARGFTAAGDRRDYGLAGSTYGRVTLYCNPHDQVISATTIQGIGWRGMSAEEIGATKGAGMFTQRVFAQGFPVGAKLIRHYDYWGNHHRKPEAGSQDFWYPESPKAGFSISKGTEANRNPVGKVVTVLTALPMKLVMCLAGVRIHALPPKVWKVPLDAPPLPESFCPKAVSFGIASERFDQGTDAPGRYRDPQRQRDAGDPYARDHRSEKDGSTDAARGDARSEAELRYAHRAELRMQAKRDGWRKSGEQVTEEERSGTRSAAYEAWRNKQIAESLAKNIDTHATDHSTIVTNAMHAEKALAYDVAIGCCDISPEDLHQLRVAADWRHLIDLEKGHSHRRFAEYFHSGKFRGQSLHGWATIKNGEAGMPSTIADEREFPPPRETV